MTDLKDTSRRGFLATSFAALIAAPAAAQTETDSSAQRPQADTGNVIDRLFSRNKPLKILPGSVLTDTADHPGITIETPTAKTSHNWVSSVEPGQPGYYQTVTIGRSGKEGSRYQVIRDTYEVELSYDGNTKRYGAVVTQYAESNYGMLHESRVTITPRGDGTNDVSVNRVRSHADSKLQLTPAQATLTPSDEKLVRQVAENANRAFKFILKNSVDPGGINPEYRAAIALPDLWGGHIIAQVGGRTYDVSRSVVAQIGGPDAKHIWLEGQYDNRIAQILEKIFGQNKVPTAVETRQAWLNDPEAEHQERYNPRLETLETNDPGRNERTYPGSNPKPSDTMRDPLAAAREAARTSRHLLRPLIAGMENNFVNADGRPDCPPETKYFGFPAKPAPKGSATPRVAAPQ